MKWAAGNRCFVEDECLDCAVSLNRLLKVPVVQVLGGIDLIGAACDGLHWQAIESLRKGSGWFERRVPVCRVGAGDVFHPVAGAIAILVGVWIDGLALEKFLFPVIRKPVCVRIWIGRNARRVEHLDQTAVIFDRPHLVGG